MQRTLARWVAQSAPGELTANTVTQSVTTRNVRRPKKVTQMLQRERRKKQHLARAQHIEAKQEQIRTSLTNTSNARDVVMAQLADQVFSKGHRHAATAMNVGFVPDGNPATPLVALAGRSRVGKTSLLRALFRSPTEVGKSNRVLRRDAINFFEVGGVMTIADLPGYGGTSLPWSNVLQHAILLRNFVRCQPSLKMLYYCMDVQYKHGVYIQDIDTLRFLAKEVPNFTIVLTKAEQINDNPKATHNFDLADIRKELVFNDIQHPVLVTSAYRMGGIDTLRFDMVMNAFHALPTERLTLSEARKVSERLYSQKELSTVRQLAIPPTYVDDQVAAWQQELAAEEAARSAQIEAGPCAAATEKEVTHANVTCDTQHAAPCPATTANVTSTADAGSVESSPNARDEEPFATDPDEVTSLAQRESQNWLVAQSTEEQALAARFSDPSQIDAYKRLVRKYQNTALTEYVKQTSPWRNPFYWPDNVIPTKHPRANIMRCPEDPTNPYLSQAVFVAPRADMYFRRPNTGVRGSSQKGRYEPDQPLRFLVKEYTIPYFPDIVDVDMHPQPWTFLGSRDAYYERSGGRQLGARLHQYALSGTVNPLADNPAPDQPALTEALKQVEAKRYSSEGIGATPIAMLRPPDNDDDDES